MKGYELLSKALNEEIDYKTIVSSPHKARYFDDFKERDYYIFLNDNMFHRCNEEGRLGAKHQDKFLNYKTLDKTFEIEKTLENNNKIQKLDTCFSLEKDCENDNIQYANHNFRTYYDKINEIIDYLEEKEQ